MILYMELDKIIEALHIWIFGSPQVNKTTKVYKEAILGGDLWEKEDGSYFTEKAIKREQIEDKYGNKVKLRRSERDPVSYGQLAKLGEVFVSNIDGKKVYSLKKIKKKKKFYSNGKGNGFQTKQDSIFLPYCRELDKCKNIYDILDKSGVLEGIARLTEEHPVLYSLERTNIPELQKGNELLNKAFSQTAIDMQNCTLVHLIIQHYDPLDQDDRISYERLKRNRALIMAGNLFEHAYSEDMLCEMHLITKKIIKYLNSNIGGRYL